MTNNFLSPFPIDFFNTALSHLDQGLKFVNSQRDNTLHFLKSNLPPELVKKVSEAVNTKNFSNYGIPPSCIAAIGMGTISGLTLTRRPLLATISLTAGILLTTNKNEVGLVAAASFLAVITNLFLSCCCTKQAQV